MKAHANTSRNRTSQRIAFRSVWQFSLRSLLIAIVLFSLALTYGVHFYRLQRQAADHEQHASNLQGWEQTMMMVSFHIPQEAWLQVAEDKKYHQEQAAACSAAKWFPWRQVPPFRHSLGTYRYPDPSRGVAQ